MSSTQYEEVRRKSMRDFPRLIQVVLGNDKDDSNNEQDSSGEDSDQENNKEEDEFVKTPSNDSGDEDETKITDKAEGDKDEEMDYTTSQLYDDVDIRLNEPIDTDKGFIQEEGTNAEITNV
ncbi:hypothetical protein Tco_0234742 [Tanacetum coccineum]